MKVKAATVLAQCLGPLTATVKLPIVNSLRRLPSRFEPSSAKHRSRSIQIVWGLEFASPGYPSLKGTPEDRAVFDWLPHSAKRPHDRTHPVCSQSDRLSAHRRSENGPVQLAAGPASRRPVSTADR